MGSGTGLISNLKSMLSGLAQQVSSLGSAMHTMNGASSGGSAGGTLVAPNPVFSSAPGIVPHPAQSQNKVAAGPTPSMSASNNGGANLTSYIQQNPNNGTLYTKSGGGGGGGSSGGSNNNSGGGGFFSNMGNNFVSAGGGTAGLANVVSNLLGDKMTAVVNTAFQGVNFVSSNLMPSTSDVVQAHLLAQRASFFSDPKHSESSSIATANSIAKLGTVTSPLDALKGMAAAQSYGLTGPNFDKMMTGVANLSNLVPGAGIEGTTRAVGAMQAGRSVNMLKGIGIQLRGPDGSLRPPDEVIDDIWKKICKDYAQAKGSSAKAPSLNAVQIGLEPGNSLDSMLNTYFGSDPILKQMVANGLIFKAQMSGGQTASAQAISEHGGLSITKNTVTAAGGTTSAVTSASNVNAASGATLTAVDTQGFENANASIVTGIHDIVQSSFLQGFQDVKETLDTLLSGSNYSYAGIPSALGNTVGGLLSSLTSLASGLSNSTLSTLTGSLTNLAHLSTTLPGLATGGPVSGNKSYLVGEKGPEIFVPSTSGNIIPNNQLTKGSGGGSTTYNFTVNLPSANTPEVIAALKNMISELNTNRKISDS